MEAYCLLLILAPIQKILFVAINLSGGLDNVCGWNSVTLIYSLEGHSTYMQKIYFFKYLKFV